MPDPIDAKEGLHACGTVLSRREMVQRMGGGLGAIALLPFLGADGASGAAVSRASGVHPPPRARRVIQL